MLSHTYSTEPSSSPIFRKNLRNCTRTAGTGRQAALEAGVETDNIFSLCKEKSDLDFNYDEWKRNPR